jgi:biopolymer transport protein ExbD
VNDDFVTPQDFRQTIVDLLRENPRKIISLKADESLPSSFMISIMNQLKEAGGTNISLITTPF